MRLIDTVNQATGDRGFFSRGRRIIENKNIFIYAFYGDAVSQTRCGRNSSVAISENGPRAVVFREPQLHREKVSLFIFFCRLRWLVCRSHDLRRFRSPDASHVLQTRSTLDVCNDDYSLFLFANIMDYFAPAWQRLHTYRMYISFRFRYAGKTSVSFCWHSYGEHLSRIKR